MFASGCSSSNKKSGNNQSKTQTTSTQSNSGGLTAFQKKNGIGPIKKKVKVGKLNPKLAQKGKEIFETKCNSCHKLGQRYVGPDLKKVTSRRTPAYIMNMIMNPRGMTHKNPTAKKLLGKFSTQMADLSIQRDQARAILEYLRSVNPDSSK